MSAIRARVQNGRLLLDAPTSLPEGAVLDLVVDDEGDDLDDADRAALTSAISRAWASVQDGRGRSVDDVLASLRNDDASRSCFAAGGESDRRHRCLVASESNRIS